MIVVTAGNNYLDIDAYASCVAYSVLLNGLGKNAIFATSAKANASVPKFILNLGFVPKENYTPAKTDKFVLLDLDNPDFFDKIVDHNRIIEIIDHHTGYEEYWATKKDVKTQIEFIGSVATIIYERFVQNGKTELLTPNLCKLLIAAILDNTLNLKASITTTRDKVAYKQLHKIGKISKNFDKEYFDACQQFVNNNVVKSVLDDVKQTKQIKYLPPIFAQLTVYNSKPILQNLQQIQNTMDAINTQWMLNIICLKNGKSYIAATNPQVKQQLETLFKAKFKKDILTLNKFMLRKQIIKLAQDKN